MDSCVDLIRSCRRDKKSRSKKEGNNEQDLGRGEQGTIYLYLKGNLEPSKMFCVRLK